MPLGSSFTLVEVDLGHQGVERSAVGGGPCLHTLRGVGGVLQGLNLLLGGALIHALLIGLLLRHSRWLHGGHLLGRWLVRVLHVDLGSWSERVRVVRRSEGE